MKDVFQEALKTNITCIFDYSKEEWSGEIVCVDIIWDGMMDIGCRFYFLFRLVENEWKLYVLEFRGTC